MRYSKSSLPHVFDARVGGFKLGIMIEVWYSDNDHYDTTP